MARRSGLRPRWSSHPRRASERRGPEAVFVVSGTFSDGVHEHPAGSFMHSQTGSAQVPQPREGCVLFVFFPEG
jgi:ChrR Cupin-like domain